MICSVPSTETLSVNVTVTNAAGRTVMKSSSSGLLKNQNLINAIVINFLQTSCDTPVHVRVLHLQNTLLSMPF